MALDTIAPDKATPIPANVFFRKLRRYMALVPLLFKVTLCASVIRFIHPTDRVRFGPLQRRSINAAIHVCAFGTLAKRRESRLNPCCSADTLVPGLKTIYHVCINFCRKTTVPISDISRPFVKYVTLPMAMMTAFYQAQTIPRAGNH